MTIEETVELTIIERLRKEKGNFKVYMERFTEEAIELSKTKLVNSPALEDRHALVTDLIEDHFEITGRMPNSYTLCKLGDYILIEDLKDKDVDKVSNNDFPILSDMQVKRRDRKQFPMEADTIDYLEAKINKRLDSLAITHTKETEY